MVKDGQVVGYRAQATLRGTIKNLGNFLCKIEAAREYARFVNNPDSAPVRSGDLPKKRKLDRLAASRAISGQPPSGSRRMREVHAVPKMPRLGATLCEPRRGARRRSPDEHSTGAGTVANAEEIEAAPALGIKPHEESAPAGSSEVRSAHAAHGSFAGRLRCVCALPAGLFAGCVCSPCEHICAGRITLHVRTGCAIEPATQAWCVSLVPPGRPPLSDPPTLPRRSSCSPMQWRCCSRRGRRAERWQRRERASKACAGTSRRCGLSCLKTLG